MKTLILAIGLLMSLNTYAINFTAHQVNGKTVYSNIPTKCVRNGVMVCYRYLQSANIEPSIRTKKTINSKKSGSANKYGVPDDIFENIKANHSESMYRFQAEDYLKVRNYENKKVSPSEVNRIKTIVGFKHQNNFDYMARYKTFKQLLGEYLSKKEPDSGYVPTRRNANLVLKGSTRN